MTGTPHSPASREPVFDIRRSIGGASRAGWFDGEGLPGEIVMRPQAALGLLADVGVDGFTALIVMGCMAREDGGGRLVVDATTAEIGERCGWHRQKAGRVLSRLREAGFVVREQDHVMTERGVRWTATRLYLEPSVFHPNHVPWSPSAAPIAETDTATFPVDADDDNRDAGSLPVSGEPVDVTHAIRRWQGEVGAEPDVVIAAGTSHDPPMHDDASSNHIIIDTATRAAEHDDSVKQFRRRLVELGFVDADRVVASTSLSHLAAAFARLDATDDLQRPGAYLRRLLTLDETQLGTPPVPLPLDGASPPPTGTADVAVPAAEQSPLPLDLPEPAPSPEYTPEQIDAALERLPAAVRRQILAEADAAAAGPRRLRSGGQFAELVWHNTVVAALLEVGALDRHHDNVDQLAGEQLSERSAAVEAHPTSSQ